MTIHEQRDPASDAELERLRGEVARLRQELQQAEEPPAPPRPRRGRTARWVGASVLFLVVALLAPLSVVATWVHDEVSDTNRYVATVTPLASDPAVQQAVVTRTTNTIMANIDVQAVTQEAVDALSQRGLPPRAAAGLSALSTPLENGVRSFVEKAVTRLVHSDAFQQAWVQINRTAHAQLVAVLTGKQTGAVKVVGDRVTLDLAPVIDKVKTRLTQAGFGLAAQVPEVSTNITLVESADITKAQTAFRLLGAVARGLPILAVLLLAAAVALAPGRRRALMVGGLVVAGSMLLLGLLLNAFRPVYLGALPPDVSASAAGAVYDTLVGFIRLNLRAVLVLFLALALVAWVTGPSAAAVSVRHGSRRAVDFVRHGSEQAGIHTGAFGASLYRLRVPIRVGIAGVVVLVYVLAAHPTGAFTIILLAIAAFVLLLVELLARPPAPAPAEAHTRSPEAEPARTSEEDTRPRTPASR
ncbi:MAG TPA: hypothetical protein VFL69_08195 [Marmoricola sp.]|nr:hypothetical protein [Marmoricola sp.]